MKDNQKGIIYIIWAAFFFALMTFCVRMAGDVPVLQKSFFRNCVAAMVSFVILLRSEEKFKIKSGSLPYLFLRAIFGTTALIANFYAVDHMNLADANILNKLSPFFAIVLSWWILKEMPHKVDWFTVIMAFVGAIFVAKPTMDIASLPALLGLYGGFGAGMAYTFVRKLGKQGERSMIVVFFFACFSSLSVSPWLIFDFHPMQWWQWAFLIGAGICGTGGQFCITTAYTKAPAKEISVFDYTQVIFAAILGFIFLDQVPDYLSIIGYIIIIGAALWRWWHGMRLMRKERRNYCE